MTLLMVTHDVEVAAVADNQFHLDHGRLVQTGAGSGLKTSDACQVQGNRGT